MDKESPKLMEGKCSFKFDSAAMINLRTMEKLLTPELQKSISTPLSRVEISSMYAAMIFNLFVYIEGNLNNGLRMLISRGGIKAPPELLGMAIEYTKQNISPFEILRWLDALQGTNYLAKTKDGFGESLRYHEKFRNLVAHGGEIASKSLHEWGEENSFSMQEPEGFLAHLIGYLKKQNLYQETEEGPSYITSVANQDIYNYFKANIKIFIQELLSLHVKGPIEAVLWCFDYEFFGLAYPKSEVSKPGS